MIRVGKVAVIVLRNDPNDGRLGRQISALEKTGYAVRIIPLFSGTIAKSASSGLLRLTQIASFKIKQQSILRQLKKFAPHIILAHEPETLSVAGQYAKTHKTPLIYDAHEFYEAQRGVDTARTNWLKKTYLENARFITAMMTVSPGLVKLYKDAYPSLPPATLVCNAAVKPAQKGYDGRLHKALGIAPATQILLYQGGLWAKRGVEDVVMASSFLHENWVTVFMGYGPLQNNLPISARLRFVEPKPQSELLAWTAGATLGVIPYPDDNLNHRYCLPNKLWEFPLAGVPIVARKLPDMEHMINTWNIGTTYDRKGDGRTLSDTILQLPKQKHQKMIANCKLFAEQENWEKYQAVFLETIDNLMAKSFYISSSTL